MTYLLFIVALSLSAVAAYYAVMGLIAIFAASMVPIAVMGSLLEVSKLVVASWLYQNWKQIPKLLKTYFTVALTVLMLLTSMGIFGFLSKAHLDQAVPTGEISAKLSIIDEKIKTEKENLNASRQELTQLDSQVNETINRTAKSDNSTGVERSIAIRKAQQKDRLRINKEIAAAQTNIAKLQEERAPIASEVRKVEAEVGPIKYIAALIYGNNPDTDLLEKAVRWVIIMIVIVFDPLAVLMLVAANWNMRHYNNKHWTSFFIKKKKIDDFPDVKDDKEVVSKKEVSSLESSSQIINLIIHDEIDLKDKPKFTQKVAEVVEVAETIVEQPQLSEEEIPEIEVDEHSKDWEPGLYDRSGVRKDVGRYMAETGKKPPRVQSFLNKVQSLFNQKTIEKEIEDLQNKK